MRDGFDQTIIDERTAERDALAVALQEARAALEAAINVINAALLPAA